MYQDHSVAFEVAPSYWISDSFVDYEGYSTSFMAFLPTLVDLMSSELNLPIAVHFSSLIPVMSMFTHCLLFDHFQFTLIPGSYAILLLEHGTLLPSPVTFTTGHCFCFGSISSFFLELFLHSSSSILGTYWPGELIFHCPIFLPFHTVHGILKARILKWFAIPFCQSGPHLVRTLHHELPILGGPTWHGS